MAEPLLRVEGLKTYFKTYAGLLKAVDGVTFDVGKGKILGIIGESGCGKTMTALSIMRLVPRPGMIAGGSIFFDGTDMTQISEREMRKIRGRHIAMVFQDALTALNPLFTVGDQIAEMYVSHFELSREEALGRTVEAMRKVGIPDVEKRVKDYPHQFSSGMRQRVMIAMAVSCSPELLLADEPTTALDVTTQAQILDLLKTLRETLGMSMIVITHDMGVAAEICDDIAVMYSGSIVETSRTQEIIRNPLHPYTQGLLSSIPRHNKRSGYVSGIREFVMSLPDLPPGCRFHPRCPYVMPKCSKELPPLIEAQPNHYVRCYLYGG